MSTEKQHAANQENALLSTGPRTEEGKVIVAANAIKHGIFTKDLVVSSIIGKEKAGEYNEMLENLRDCFMPQNQMESLLVEKIAVDFWRLRRVIRYEAGSIAKHLETIVKGFYTYGKKKNAELDEEIMSCQRYMSWIDLYVEYLEKGEVDFDAPTWERENIESDISDDFSLIIQKIDTITYQERESARCGGYSYEQLKSILKENGFTNKKKITNRLLELYSEEKRNAEEKISEFEQKKLANSEADKVNTMLGSIPEEENMNKILKYERSLQKSIFQNLVLLKKLQGSL